MNYQSPSTRTWTSTSPSAPKSSSESSRRWNVSSRRASSKDVRLEDGELKFQRAKTSVPKGMKKLTQKVYDQMPRINLTDLLVAVDSPVGFTRHFTHLKGPESPPKI